MSDLTIITPTIPEREALFDECIDSVRAQTEPCLYRYAIDKHHNGPAATVNALAECVTTEWLCRLDDDDLLDPDHVAVLSRWLDDDADIVYTWCRVEGGPFPADFFQKNLQAEPGGWRNLYEVNWIPATYAIRTTFWRELGGLRDVEEEDWELLQRAVEHDARIVCVPAVTWTYRLNDAWAHRSDEIVKEAFPCES